MRACWTVRVGCATCCSATRSPGGVRRRRRRPSPPTPDRRPARRLTRRRRRAGTVRCAWRCGSRGRSVTTPRVVTSTPPVVSTPSSARSVTRSPPGRSPRATSRCSWTGPGPAPPELTTAVLDRMGDRLTSTPSTRIGTVVNAALAGIDPRGQADRAHHARRHEVGVTQRSLPDGLGQITVIDKVEVTRAMIELLDDDADRILVHSQHCEPCAEDDPGRDRPGPRRRAARHRVRRHRPRHQRARHDLRDHQPVRRRSGIAADAATAGHGRTIRRVGVRGAGSCRSSSTCATLLGLADNPALLAGQPVPAGLAREMATECGSLRRIVTDPVDGHLLDYGTRTYLPHALKDHIAARDGTCRAPGCNQPAWRCEMDHVTPFPHGPSAVAQHHHALPTRPHHQDRRRPPAPRAPPPTAPPGGAPATARPASPHHAPTSHHRRTSHRTTTNPAPSRPRRSVRVVARGRRAQTRRSTAPATVRS